MKTKAKFGLEDARAELSCGCVAHLSRSPKDDYVSYYFHHCKKHDWRPAKVEKVHPITK